MASFSDRLYTLRKQAGLTQEELAKKVGLHKQSISQYERGVRHPDYNTLDIIGDIFNVSTDYLLGNTDVTVKYVNSEELSLLNNGGVKKVPVMGIITAGGPDDAVSDINQYIEIPFDWTGEYGALKVKGDSMEPEIHEGDILIFRHQETARTGDIVVALIDGLDSTVKKLVRARSKVILKPINPSYSPIIFSNCEKSRLKILGKVVELRRGF